MSNIDVLVTVQREDASRYYKNLSAYSDFNIQLVSDTRDALDTLADRDQHIDVLVLDNNLEHAFELITELRHTYPRLFIVLVDEDADFGMPGQADEISTEPFENNDLIRRITRLMSDRQLETLRADSLPAVRQFAKELRKAAGEMGKQQATVEACKNLGFDYVAFYRQQPSEDAAITLRAQDGSPTIQAIAPKVAAPDDLMTWVNPDRTEPHSGPQGTPNHPLVVKGRLGAVACIPVVFSGNHYGVLVACREEPASITQENVLMLELITAQLGAAISKESIG